MQNVEQNIGTNAVMNERHHADCFASLYYKHKRHTQGSCTATQRLYGRQNLAQAAPLFLSFSPGGFSLDLFTLIKLNFKAGVPLIIIKLTAKDRKPSIQEPGSYLIL